MNAISQLFNSWHIIRWMGLLAFFFFTMSLAYGMLSRFKRLKERKALFHFVHVSSSWAGTLAVLVHMLLLIVNHYQPYTALEIFVPFTANYMRIASALGVLAFYLFLIVLFTSDVMFNKLKRTTWKAVHLMVFPSWLLMLIHSVWMGTDSFTWWGEAVYAIAAAVILILFVFYYREQKIKIGRSQSLSEPHGSR